MADVRGGKVTETKTSYKTTGSADLPGTVNPEDSDAYNNTNAPFNHDSNDVSHYVGVSSEYRTYSDVRNKPLGTAADVPDFLPESMSVEEADAPVEAKSSTKKAAPAPAVPPKKSAS